jgi:hypothetical protein
MEADLQSLFGLHVTWCAQLYSLAEAPQSPPPHWDSYTTALLVSKHRRQLFVTPWVQGFIQYCLLPEIKISLCRSVLLYLVLLAVIIVFWVGGHQSILLNAFNCWLLQNIISLWAGAWCCTWCCWRSSLSSGWAVTRASCSTLSRAGCYEI